MGTGCDSVLSGCGGTIGTGCDSVLSGCGRMIGTGCDSVLSGCGRMMGTGCDSALSAVWENETWRGGDVEMNSSITSLCEDAFASL